MPVEVQLKKYYDVWGSDKTYAHMAVGWTWAMDTPYKWTKQIASYLGGTRNGMVVAWPGHIKDAGGIRNQFHHVIDIVPTILEVTGIQAPESVDGIYQKPIEGVKLCVHFRQGECHRGFPSPHAVFRNVWHASALSRRMDCQHPALPRAVGRHQADVRKTSLTD